MIYKIKDENLNNASCNALMEANRWNAVAMQIDNQKGLYREKIVILAYSSELYFKCILMNNGINITSFSKEVLKNGHNLFELFKLLPNKTKELIKNELSFEPVMVMDFFTGRIKQKCSTIEEILQLISTNFLELRYIYEKYANGEPVLVINGVMEELTDCLKKIANGLNFNTEVQ